MIELSFTEELIVRKPIYRYSGLNYEIENYINLFSDKLFQEAIFLASPSLYKKLIKLLDGNLHQDEDIGLIITLIKYYNRMSTRCTPFGLFSGCSVVVWDDKLRLNFCEDFYRETRLDLNVTVQYINSCIKHREIRKRDIFFKNKSIRQVGNEYQYIEIFYKSDVRKHRLCSLTKNKFLSGILKISDNGIMFSEMMKFLIARGIDYRNAFNYINELINAQVLNSSLSPTFVGDDTLTFFLNRLNEIKPEFPNKNFLNIINSTQLVINGLKKIDSEKDFLNDEYTNIQILVEQIISHKYDSIFHVNTFPKLEENSSLNFEIQSQLKNTFELLYKLQGGLYFGRKSIQKFISKFNDRYENQNVPILELFDIDTGLDYSDKKTGQYPNSLTDEIHLTNIQRKEPKVWTAIDSFLLKQMHKFLTEGTDCINLTNDDFIEFPETSNDHLPNTMSIIFNVLSNSERNPKLCFRIACGSSANMILGRFTTGNPEIMNVSKKIADYESSINESKILAEIVHIPEDRIANVITRAKLREYEIPVFCSSQNNTEHQINLDDILVSVENNKVVLRSKKIGKEIIPFLSNAHAYSGKSLAIYQFLSDLQHQNINSAIRFEWGLLKTEFEYFPRVQINSIIVNPAQWILKKEKYLELLDIQDEDLICAFKNWINKFKIPEIFLITDNDNYLVINSTNILSIKVFISELKKNSIVYLEEFLFDTHDRNLVINECVAPVLIAKNNEKENRQHNFRNNNNNNNNNTRKFVPGSEWLYIKIYCGEKTAEEVLLGSMTYIINDLKRKKIIDRWFFIRYADPKSHLRIRFHFIETKDISMAITIINDFLNKFHKRKAIEKIQIDTYEREIERYHACGIEQAEYLFCYDSEFTLKILDLINRSESHYLRDIMIFKSIDNFLNDFKLSLEEKLEFAEYSATGFSSEFVPHNSQALRKQLNTKYSKLRKNIESLLNQDSKTSCQFQDVIKRRSEKNSQIIEQIFSLISNKKIDLELFSLLGSYIHMNINRYFISDQRFNEFVIYELLKRYYKSSIERSKQNVNDLSSLNLTSPERKLMNQRPK